tara:strand:- start:1350 stop:1784 length:435 start_codon:yes stop_codon:yes gene_type:complete
MKFENYPKELTVFNIYVLEEMVTSPEENNEKEKEYTLTSIDEKGNTVIHDSFDYNDPSRVVDNMGNFALSGTAPNGVVIVSNPEPYFRENINFPKKQLGKLESSMIGFVELDNEHEVDGVSRALNEKEMKYFTSELRKKLLSYE